MSDSDLDVSAGVAAITVICADLAENRCFYEKTLGLPVHWSDDVSAVFRFGGTFVNLLDVSAAPELIEPATVSTDRAGVSAVYTVEVADVDAAAATLERRGVALLNGPVARPWGPRTVSFRDPAGTVWELATN